LRKKERKKEREVLPFALLGYDREEIIARGTWHENLSWDLDYFTLLMSIVNPSFALYNDRLLHDKLRISPLKSIRYHEIIGLYI